MARHEIPDFRDRIEYAALAGLLSVLRLPPRGMGRAWGRSLGSLVSRFLPIRRDAALENLRASFPEKSEGERRAIYRGMCETLGTTLAEFARFGSGRPQPAAEWIRLANLDAVGRARAAGQGALLMSAHFGNWEVLGAAVAARGIPVTALGARQRNPLAEALFTRYRSRQGVRTVNVGKSLKPLLEVLSEGACVATAADQDGGPDGFRLEFLGRPASVQSGLFRLMARRGTPMVIGFSILDGDGWRAEIQDPVFPEPSRDPEAVEAEARRLAALYTAQVEAYVRRYPDHWFWVHRRWRTRLEPESRTAGGGPA